MGEVRRGGLPAPAGRAINPALFLVGAICFFLPFFTVECDAAIPEALEGLAEGLGEGQDFDFGDQSLSESVTGWQLVVGDTGEAAPPGSPPVEDPGPDYLAMAAFAAAVLGIVLSGLRRPLGPALAVVLGVAGSVLLVIVWKRISGRIPEDARAFVELKTEPAFWISVVASGLAALWGGVRLFAERDRGPRPAAARTEPLDAAEPPPP